MTKLAIFHHVYQTGNWESIYSSQLLEMQQSGLFDAADYIFTGVNGDAKLPYNINKINKIHYNKNNDPPTEYYTIKALYDYSNLNPDTFVLFVHTKGVTWTVTEQNKNNVVRTNVGDFTVQHVYDSTQSWRKYLEYFLIRNWKRCVYLLSFHDTVGTEWTLNSTIDNRVYDIPHYAGGMWWAKSNYIKTLDANFITNNMIIGRYATELWIGTKNPNYYNFHTIDRNLYLFPVTPVEYEGLS